MAPTKAWSNTRSIHTLACRMLGDESIAEDAVQETFLRAYRQLHRYESRSSFSTWLYRIAANRCIDMLRGRELIAEARPEPVAAGPGPHALAVATEVRSSLRAALRHLTHQERAAFLLRHYEGCPSSRWPKPATRPAARRRNPEPARADVVVQLGLKVTRPGASWLSSRMEEC
jgi:RNA polymerase sigma factor (sigma-70 family)